MKSAYSEQNQQFEQKVRIALYEVAQSLSEVTATQLPNYKLIQKKSDNYYLVDINEPIDAATLEYFLQVELEKLQIHTPYEYGIYDCDTDQMIYGAFIDPDENNSQKPSITELPTSDDLVYYFGVLFPDKSTYILGQSWMPFALSGLLLLSLIFFGYGINELNHQRKLTTLQKSFIDQVAHELKTPLSVVKVASDVLLEETQENSRAKQYASIVQKQNENLVEQIQRILDVSKTNSSYFSIKKEDIPIVSLLSETIENVRNTYPEAVIEFNQDSKNKILSADSYHMKKVITNLVENSIKYSSGTSIVRVDLYEDKLSVSDNGIGIVESEIPHITKEFYRSKNQQESYTEGFGLGLYYVDKIVRLHGWKMNIDSKIGLGTTITIHFL